MRARSRLVKFSIRGLLVLVALVAIGLSMLVIPARKQKASRLWVESQRGDYSYGQTAGPIPEWMVDALGIDLFASVTVVHLGTDEIYDLRPLAGLADLEELYINQFVHDEADFADLKSLRNLRKLELTEWSGVDRSDLPELSAILPGVEITLDDS